MPPFITGAGSLNFVTKYNYNSFQYSSNWNEFATEVTSFRTYINNFQLNLNGLDHLVGDRALSIAHVDGRLLVGTGQGGSNYYSNRSSLIVKSDDKGQTWSESKAFGWRNYTYSINHLTGDTLLATTGGHSSDGEVYKSNDKGDSWYIVSDVSAHDTVYQTSYLGNGVVLFGSGYNSGDGEIWRSTNYGEQNTWTKVRDTGLPQGTSSSNSISQISYLGNDIVLAVQNSNNELLRSTDAGLTWSTVSGVTPDASYLCSLGGGIAILSKRDTTGIRIYRTTNYGQSWTNLGIKVSDPGQSYTLGRAAAGFSNLGDGNVILSTYKFGALTGGGALYLSQDNGLTWSSDPVFNPSVKTLVPPILMGNDMFIPGRTNADEAILYHINT